MIPCLPDVAPPLTYPIQVTPVASVIPPTTPKALDIVILIGILILVKGREPLTTEIVPRVIGMPNTIT